MVVYNVYACDGILRWSGLGCSRDEQRTLTSPGYRFGNWRTIPGSRESASQGPESCEERNQSFVPRRSHDRPTFARAIIHFVRTRPRASERHVPSLISLYRVAGRPKATRVTRAGHDHTSDCALRHGAPQLRRLSELRFSVCLLIESSRRSRDA